MASQTRSPASNAGVGDDTGFANPANAYASNNTYATVGPNLGDGAPVEHNYYNFGFEIPDGATVEGVVVELEDKIQSEPNGTITSNLRLLKTSTERGQTFSNVGGDNYETAPSTTEEYRSHGGVSDLWGQTWTPAEINSTDFGARIRAFYEASGPPGESEGPYSLDHIRITVYYTGGEEPAASTNSGFFLVLR